MNTPLPVPIPNHKLGQALQRMVGLGKKPCFRIGGLRITIAGAFSTNPGALYIKDDNWNYIGKVTYGGFIEIAFPSLINKVQKKLLLDAIIDPEGTAIAEGLETGTCCCCGRTLTNKLSMKLGIGPICRGQWFPDVIINPVDTVAMLEAIDSLEELTDSLELDLGAPTVQEPTISELAASYFALDSRQKDVFLGLIDIKIERELI